MKKPLSVELAERKGEIVAESMGISSFPVDPFAVAAKHAITVGERELCGCMGCLMKVGDSFGILYAAGLGNSGVVHFTVAHELGHFFLERHAEQLFPEGEGQHFSKSGFISNDVREREADSFAVGLLMPERLFRMELRDCGAGFAAIQKLSVTCETSITATAIRYATFSDDPVAVIVSHGKMVDFCFMSESLREGASFEWLRKGESVPSGSVTASFNRHAGNMRLGKTAEGYSSLATWFDRAPDIEMMEDVVGLGRYERTLTVLFTEEALGADEYDERDEDD